MFTSFWFGFRVSWGVVLVHIRFAVLWRIVVWLDLIYLVQFELVRFKFVVFSLIGFGLRWFLFGSVTFDYCGSVRFR
jgi:hypothetical protein